MINNSTPFEDDEIKF